MKQDFIFILRFSIIVTAIVLILNHLSQITGMDVLENIIVALGSWILVINFVELVKEKR